MTTMAAEASMREVFTSTVSEALDTYPDLAVVLADISADRFTEAAERHPSRVINVGIREQALISVAGGLALTGMRPVVHSITPFLVERPFEQLKLDFNHQGVGAIAVSTGASYDYPGAGRTHMAPGDVALLDTLPDWTVHVPGHPAEVSAALRQAIPGNDRVYVRLSDRVNDEPHGLDAQVVRWGGRGVVVAVGPMLRPVLAATGMLDVTVVYMATVRPFDGGLLRRAVRASTPDVVLVEPYLEGTSAHLVGNALIDVPHRLLSTGVRRDQELRAYGTADEHEAAHGLGPVDLSRRLAGFLR